MLVHFRYCTGLLVETYQPADLVCIVETWLDHNISDNEIHFLGFQLYQFDHNRHGGGILMYAQHNLIVNVLPSQLQYNVPHNLEFLPFLLDTIILNLESPFL